MRHAYSFVHMRRGIAAPWLARLFRALKEIALIGVPWSKMRRLNCGA